MKSAEVFGENEFLAFAPLKSGRVVPAETAAKMARQKELELGMVTCPECGGEAKIEMAGEKSGQAVVYAGCFRTERCVRRSVRGEGWDEEDGAREWNRRNGGIVGWWIRLRNWLCERWAEKRIEWGLRLRGWNRRKSSIEKISGDNNGDNERER